MRTQSVGIEMPDEFPTAMFDRLQVMVLERVRPRSEQAWGEASRGWNNVAYRFRAAADDSDSFIASVSQHGAAPDHEERYQQERCLYGFFVGGESSVESFGYSAWSVCSAISPTRFPIATANDLKQVSLEKLRDKLNAEFGESDFWAALRSVLATPHWQSWKEIRNVLAHRAAIARTHSVGVFDAALSTAKAGQPSTRSSTWNVGPGVDLDDSLTANRRTWLAETLAELLTQYEAFLDLHLPAT